MNNLYTAILIGALVLMCLAKLVGSSGDSHILTIDYAGIADPEKLHRWAAKCLYGAAIASGSLALAAFMAPSYARLFLALFFAYVVGTAITISIGASRFRRQ